MTNLILSTLLILCLAWPSHALSPAISQGTQAKNGSSCDSCSSNLIFSWHAEDATIANGTPCGCNTNVATSVTLTDATLDATQKSDGTKSLYKNGGTQYATVNTDVSKTAGTLVFDLYWSTHADWASVITFPVDANNAITVQKTSGSTELILQWKGTGNTVNLYGTANLIPQNTWTTITAKWRTGTTDPSLSIQCGVNAAVTDNTDLTAITGTPSQMQFYDTGASDAVMRVDNIKLYDAWIP